MAKKVFFIAFMVLVVVLPLTFLNAAEYLPKDKQSAGNVIVGGSQKYHNLYVAGGSVVINKKILGDLFSAGGSVNVAGEVENDLFAVGGNVSVSSPVGDDARLVGGNLVINAPIGGDVLAAGGTISISEGADIGGDFWAAGGVVNISSAVAGNVKIAGGEIFINGVIGGVVEVRADKKLTFGPQSRVTGPIVYYGRSEAIVQDGAQVGPIEFKSVQKQKWFPIIAGLSIFFFLKLATVLIAGLILLTLFRKTSLAIVSSVYNNFWTNLGVGIVGVFAVPIAATLLMVTVIGVYSGIVLIVWFTAVTLIGGLFAVMLTGAIIETWIKKKKEIQLSWFTVLWGVLAGGLLILIPFVGWLVVLLLYLVTFGAILRATKQKFEM
ncbi:hypothetical protein IIA95_03815 [Patescibacteria group bacterium]|nr:hypothetical protein [Patescibacteria group bacterium]